MKFNAAASDSCAQAADRGLGSKSSDKAIIEAIAADAGISLNGFRSNEHLDTYFDFSLDHRDGGYIAKAQSDPGVRVGDLVMTTPQAIDDLLFFEYLADRCALEGVSLSRHIDALGCAWSLESVVYSSGLNAPTLRQVCANLVECAELVRNACAGQQWLQLDPLEMEAQGDHLPS